MKALIIIDVQNDFMPTGSLPVKEGDQIIPFINAEMQKGYDLVVAGTLLPIKVLQVSIRVKSLLM